MIYTIGYQKMSTPAALVALLKENGITTLVDVRSKPYSRKYAFNGKRLDPVLAQAGIKYIWGGKTLGGFGEITDRAIGKLAEFQAGKKMCLMCMEADPDKCHRKYEIAARLEKNHQVPATHFVSGPNGGWTQV